MASFTAFLGALVGLILHVQEKSLLYLRLKAAAMFPNVLTLGPPPPPVITYTFETVMSTHTIMVPPIVTRYASGTVLAYASQRSPSRTTTFAAAGTAAIYHRVPAPYPSILNVGPIEVDNSLLGLFERTERFLTFLFSDPRLWAPIMIVAVIFIVVNGMSRVLASRSSFRSQAKDQARKTYKWECENILENAMDRQLRRQPPVDADHDSARDILFLEASMSLEMAQRRYHNEILRIDRSGMLGALISCDRGQHIVEDFVETLAAMYRLIFRPWIEPLFEGLLLIMSGISLAICTLSADLVRIGFWTTLPLCLIVAFLIINFWIWSFAFIALVGLFVIEILLHVGVYFLSTRTSSFFAPDAGINSWWRQILSTLTQDDPSGEPEQQQQEGPQQDSQGASENPDQPHSADLTITPVDKQNSKVQEENFKALQAELENLRRQIATIEPGSDEERNQKLVDDLKSAKEEIAKLKEGCARAEENAEKCKKYAQEADGRVTEAKMNALRDRDSYKQKAEDGETAAEQLRSQVRELEGDLHEERACKSQYQDDVKSAGKELSKEINRHSKTKAEMEKQSAQLEAALESIRILEALQRQPTPAPENDAVPVHEPAAPPARTVEDQAVVPETPVSSEATATGTETTKAIPDPSEGGIQATNLSGYCSNAAVQQEKPASPPSCVEGEDTDEDDLTEGHRLRSEDPPASECSFDEATTTEPSDPPSPGPGVTPEIPPTENLSETIDEVTEQLLRSSIGETPDRGLGNSTEPREGAPLPLNLPRPQPWRRQILGPAYHVKVPPIRPASPPSPPKTPVESQEPVQCPPAEVDDLSLSGLDSDAFTVESPEPHPEPEPEPEPMDTAPEVLLSQSEPSFYNVAPEEQDTNGDVVIEDGCTGADGMPVATGDDGADDVGENEAMDTADVDQGDIQEVAMDDADVDQGDIHNEAMDTGGLDDNQAKESEEDADLYGPAHIPYQPQNVEPRSIYAGHAVTPGPERKRVRFAESPLRESRLRESPVYDPQVSFQPASRLPVDENGNVIIPEFVPNFNAPGSAAPTFSSILKGKTRDTSIPEYIGGGDHGTGSVYTPERNSPWMPTYAPLSMPSLAPSIPTATPSMPSYGPSTSSYQPAEPLTSSSVPEDDTNSFAGRYKNLNASLSHHQMMKNVTSHKDVDSDSDFDSEEKVEPSITAESSTKANLDIEQEILAHNFGQIVEFLANDTTVVAGPSGTQGSIVQVGNEAQRNVEQPEAEYAQTASSQANQGPPNVVTSSTSENVRPRRRIAMPRGMARLSGSASPSRSSSPIDRAIPKPVAGSKRKRDQDDFEEASFNEREWEDYDIAHDLLEKGSGSDASEEGEPPSAEVDESIRKLLKAKGLLDEEEEEMKEDSGGEEEQEGQTDPDTDQEGDEEEDSYEDADRGLSDVDSVPYSDSSSH